MTCDEAKLQVQALADGELSESVIPEVMDHVQSCYSCRADYVELLKLQKKMSGLVYEVPPKEWFEKLERRIGRKIGSGIGQILFFGSYLLLIAYAVFSLFADSGVGMFIKIAVAGILLGVLSLLGFAISDRIHESKDDKYKGVVK